MTPADLERLAEACERAAEYLRDSAGHCSDYPRIAWCNDCLRDYDQSDALAAHARAIRAGRVTVTPETPVLPPTTGQMP